MLTGTEIGGQAATTDRIENYPGFPDGISGSELAELFQKNAERFGARLEYDVATEVDLTKRPFIVKTYGNEYRTKTLIISTGASPNKLNVPGEQEFAARACPIALPATVGSSRIKMWPLWAAATARWKKVFS